MLTETANYVLWGFVSVFLALAICLSAEGLGRKLRVIDQPDGGRKRHKRPTPLIGGMAIIVPLVIWLAAASFVGGKLNTPLTMALLVCATGVGTMGFTDDQSRISPLARILFLGVFLFAATAIDQNLIVPALYWGDIAPTPVAPGLFVGILIVSAIGIANAVNMADGQNGLVAGLFVIWSICLMLLGDPVITLTATLLALLSAIVFAFNFRGVLFLGGCGSYGVSFVFGLLTLAAYAGQLISIQTMAVWFFVPVLDCLRLLVVRLARRRSPSHADRDHFHHRLQERFGPDLSLAIYLGTSALASVGAVLYPHHAMGILAIQAIIYLSCAWVTSAKTASAGFKSADRGPRLLAPPAADLHAGLLSPLVVDRRLDALSRSAASPELLSASAAQFAVHPEDN